MAIVFVLALLCLTSNFFQIDAVKPFKDGRVRRYKNSTLVARDGKQNIEY